MEKAQIAAVAFVAGALAWQLLLSANSALRGTSKTPACPASSGAAAAPAAAATPAAAAPAEAVAAGAGGAPAPATQPAAQAAPKEKEEESEETEEEGSDVEVDTDDDAPEYGFFREDSTVVPENVALKMVVLVRDDLGMSKGKIAAQVGHAVLGVWQQAVRRGGLPREWVKAWEFRACAKICLKVPDEATMHAAAAAARAAGIPACIIEDAGRTEVEPGTKTVCGLGPAPIAELDKITGPKGPFKLKLLS